MKMRLSVTFFILPILGVTMLMVGYVYQKNSIMELSYRLQANEQQQIRLAKATRQLTYEVNTMESPIQLETMMHDLKVKLVTPERIIMIKRVIQIPINSALRLADNATKGMRLRRLLGLEQEALATTVDSSGANAHGHQNVDG